uniref:reticulocalbin-2 isoform X1 n=1 Tax=Myxine glutinosa TaxID=7769 RepID=UPI00358EB8A8
MAGSSRMVFASTFLATMVHCCLASVAKAGGKLSQEHYIDDHHSYEYDREALLGGEEEVEDFSKLNPEEAEQQLKLLVKKIDRDANGLLSKEELSDWTLRSFRRYATEEARRRFPEVDENGDQVVTWNEYLSHEFGTKPGDEDGHEELAAFQELYVKEKKKFEMADADGVKGLNPMEFVAFEHPEETDYMLDYVLDEAMSEHDHNSDGSVGLNEFIGDYQPDPGALNEPEWVIIEKEKFSNDLDKDHDGKLSRKELLPWVIPNNMDAADDEADHLLEHMDSNGDGLLSEAEVLSNSDVFLGSEVTDYGRQLGDNHVLHEEL